MWWSSLSCRRRSFIIALPGLAGKTQRTTLIQFFAAFESRSHRSLETEQLNLLWNGIPSLISARGKLHSKVFPKPALICPKPLDDGQNRLPNFVWREPGFFNSCPVFLEELRVGEACLICDQGRDKPSTYIDGQGVTAGGPPGGPQRLGLQHPPYCQLSIR